MKKKHAEFHYLDPDVITRDFPRMPELQPADAFALALAGRGRGPFMARIELACWHDQPKRHTLGQIFASEDGRVIADPWLSSEGRPSLHQQGERLYLDCQPCRRAGRILRGTLDLRDLMGLAAWMSTVRNESGDQPRRVERRIVALPDEIERHASMLAASLGHEDSVQRRERMGLRSRLILGFTRQGDGRNRP